jgi:L-alanine-DL-glutamate epimerase-like enolase superfamily enzyme
MKKAIQNIMGRRSFLGAAGLGAAAFWSEDSAQAYQNNVNTNSKPTDLKITDMRLATVARAPMTCPIIKLETNQGLVGWGEVRDGASETYALVLKRQLLGENPCNVDKLFKKIKQFGGHARQAGGVCGVEMALWDLAGKAYAVPAYQMLGGKFRDSVRCYADTDMSPDPKIYANRMKGRLDMGFTFLKMDLGIRLVEKIPGMLTKPLGLSSRETRDTMHFFTGIEITDRGIAMMADYVAQVREIIGMEVPLAADHFGHIGVNSCIRLGRALQPYNMAWLEDMIPWQFPEQWKQITDAIDVPTLTGEDIYLKEPFQKLCETHAVDIIHPDLASSGGLLETKKMGDMAQEHGVPMAMHFAGTPISCMANVHCAAATQNFLSLENHSVDVPWWNDMVEGIEKPIVNRGFIKVPEGPGLGIEVNEDVVKEHLHPQKPGFFEPTDEWNGGQRVNDRLWS